MLQQRDRGAQLGGETSAVVVFLWCGGWSDDRMLSNGLSLYIGGSADGRTIAEPRS